MNCVSSGILPSRNNLSDWIWNLASSPKLNLFSRWKYFQRICNAYIAALVLSVVGRAFGHFALFVRWSGWVLVLHPYVRPWTCTFVEAEEKLLRRACRAHFFLAKLVCLPLLNMVILHLNIWCAVENSVCMSWGLALWRLSTLLNPTPEFISQPWWTQRQFGSILSNIFLRRVFQLNCRGGSGSELICIQKCTRVQLHMLFFRTLLAVCVFTIDVQPNPLEKSPYETQECSPCNPIWEQG